MISCSLYKELFRRIGIPYTTAVKYLKALQKHGFISVSREGNRVIYPDETEEILPICRTDQRGYTFFTGTEKACTR